MEPLSKRKITRNRELLACTDCRRKKLKCDRCTPCGSCAKRGDHTTCTYQRFTDRSKHERERRLQAEARLEHLQELVQHFSQQSNEPDHQVQLDPRDPGPSLDGGESQVESGVSMPKHLLYNGSTHWSAMLEDIEELRYAIISSEGESRDEEKLEAHLDTATKLVLGPATPLPLRDLFAQYLPSQPESDDLVATYFRSAGVAAPFIHASSFKRQYMEFWQSPRQASALWTSILFSIYHVASNALTPAKQSPHLEQRYIIASASCLALGEYYRPQKFAVESLLLFAQAHVLSGPSMSPNVGLIFGLLTRLATSMGYHRDPALFQLSAFETEMRRRVWSLCMQLDLLISFQLGLPSNIQFPTWDTLPPSNLDDTDFDEETCELPPARPDSEMTNIIFYIAKHRLMTVFEKILRHSLTTGKDVTCHVNELDDEIRKVYSNLPQNLRPKLISESIFDPPKTIVTRLCVFNLYQKCLCVLHRPYVTKGRSHSIQTCHDAALNIVRYFNDSYRQFLPGGQMESERWFLGSLTWHDYLLGVTSLCLALCATIQHSVKLQINLDEILNSLRQTRDICVEQSIRSKDSARVSRLCDATLLRFGDFKDSVNGDTETIAGDYTDSFDSLSGGSSLLDHTDNFDFGPFIGTQEPEGLDETMIPSVDDPTWGYLEQFLDLSDGNIMAAK